MKKTLLCLAIGCALAGQASAANVNIYGVIDTGFAYNHTSVTGQDSTSSFQMKSGQTMGSRWGLRGTEDLGNGYTIGFTLESGFNSDTGSLMKDSTIFARQSFIDLKGAIGHIYAGRMFSLSGDTGVAGFYGSILSPLGTGWGTHNGYGEVQKYQGRFNNTIVYVSPKFAGTEILAQYSMGDSDDNKSSNDRYAALGFKNVTGGLTWGVLVDWLNKKSYYSDGTAYGSDDAWTFNIGGNYNCGFARTYLAFQYFKDLDDLSGVISNNISDWDTAFMVSNGLTIDGFGVSAGVSVPALGGEVKVMAGYMDGSSNGEAYDFDVSTWTVFAGYLYRFTKRTHVYAGAGYVERELEVNSGAAAGYLGKHKEKQTEIVCGLVHTF